MAHDSVVTWTADLLGGLSVQCTGSSTLEKAFKWWTASPPPPPRSGPPISVAVAPVTQEEKVLWGVALIRYNDPWGFARGTNFSKTVGIVALRADP